MRSMAHPDFRYTPWTAERRERASRAAKARIAAAKSAPLGYSGIADNWLRGMRVVEVAGLCGLSKGQVSGYLWRNGYCRCKRTPPAGYKEIPPTEIEDAVASTMMGHDAQADHADLLFRAALLVSSAMFVEPWPTEMARWSGYPVEECRRVYDVMRSEGLWRNGRMADPDRYMAEGIAGMLPLALDAMLCAGWLKRKVESGEERWWPAEGMP